MPYQNLPDTLYLIRQPSGKFGVDHYGILDVGNVLNQRTVIGDHPVVIHQTPPRVRMDWLQNTGTWVIEGHVEPGQLQPAIARVSIALQNQEYDFFSNNCEQFARFIVEGNKYSTQLQAVSIVATLVALPILFRG